MSTSITYEQALASKLAAARARLAATIANEVRANGGMPPSDDNPHILAAKKEVDELVEEADRLLDPWNNA
ncbi:hypothetical protein ABZW49_10160 [Nonomuraea wenchangensis]